MQIHPKPHPIFTSADILRAMPKGRAILQQTIADRLGAENDAMLHAALLHQCELGAVTCLYGRLWVKS